jgi:hypothetical protein
VIGGGSRPSLRRALLRVLLLALAGVALGACELRAELNVSVDDDGSGTVEVAVGLDEEALERRPDVFDEIDLSDLEGTGWEVVGPTEEADGFTWLRARHAYGAPEEVGPLVDQVAGEDGPLRDFRLVREDSFAETRYDFTGTVDFTGGAAGVTDDPELAEALGAEPIQLLEERIGAAVDELVRVQVAVRLPGDVESNAPTQASNGAVWRPSIVEREAVELQASSTLARTERWAWAAVAVVAGFALLLYLLIVAVRWRRSRNGAPPAA